MIKINNITSIELDLFIKALSHYITVLKYNASASENNAIKQSIAKILVKDIRKKLLKMHPFQAIVWQLHLHQSIVFQGALLSYKASSVASIEEKINSTKLLINLNNQTKHTYEKAS